MSGHLEPGFGPLDLESLSEAEAKAAGAHLDQCASCAAEFRGSADALATLALSLPPVQPPAGLRARVLESAARANRFEKFAAETAEILDLGLEKARELLSRIDDAASWVASALPGVTLYHLTGGPRVANAVAGFVKIAPGSVFPDHTHQGDEVALVLQGSCRDSSGRVVGRGETVRMGEGSTHALVALDGPDFIYLATVQNGLVMFGQEIKPGDPRL
jgi:anti-sigma factor ChrR (cupin superfamily)